MDASSGLMGMMGSGTPGDATQMLARQQYARFAEQAQATGQEVVPFSIWMRQHHPGPQGQQPPQQVPTANGQPARAPKQDKTGLMNLLMQRAVGTNPQSLPPQQPGMPPGQ